MRLKVGRLIMYSRYEDIQLVGPDSAAHRKKYKLSHGTRMILLRRTLRSSPQIAAMVHNLKVPVPPQGVSLEEYHNLVASIVMSCPNLESLVGLYPNYNHSFTRLFHALSTRQRLKEMNWMIEASPFQRQHRIRSSSGNLPQMSSRSMDVLTPGDLQPQQSAAFLENHLNWGYLTTLTIHCFPGATLTPDTLISTTLQVLPSLQNLYLSHLPVTAFNDGNLLSLPPLKKLSLSYLPGVSSVGLSALATGSASQSLTMLSIRHSNLDSLAALARIFSNFPKLETFSLVQSFPPTLPEDTFIWLMPYLASASLRKLHWDITTPSTSAYVADSILARSIGAAGFPSLRILRTPNDPEGIFQAHCRPQERADSASDRFRGLGQGNGNGKEHGLNQGSISSNRPITPGSPTKQHPQTPTSPMFPQDHFNTRNHPNASPTPREASDLHQARLAAQSRLDAARRFPRYFVNVIDEDGVLIEKYGIAGFMGTVESKILYWLHPDAGATDDTGGLVDVPDLLGDGGEELAGKEGCSGRWNTASKGPIDKKDKERWWHTERGRWTAVQMA
jgi:hypothetical protein